MAAGESAHLEVEFVADLAGASQDGHKTVRWAASLDEPEPGRLRLRIALRGRPRWFGLSLVQGYLIEPALSLLAGQAGGVLLPAAGIVVEGHTILLVGRSGTGKTSLSLRSLAAGLPVLGDDQVFVAADGSCTRFPRRLRLYDDARRTAPRAIARLPRRARAGLALRQALRTMSRGYVSPSMAVHPAALGGSNAHGTAPLGQVVLLSRRQDSTTLDARPADVAEALEGCADALAEQRRRLLLAVDEGWAGRVATIAERERALLLGALSGARISALEVPTDAGAVAAIDAVARELGLP